MRHLVTGAGSGIGARPGPPAAPSAATSWCCWRAREAAGRRRCAPTCPDAAYVVADLADPGTINGLGRQVGRPLDSLVHVAGVVDLAPVSRAAAARSGRSSSPST